MPLLVLLHHGQIFLWDDEEEAAAARALYAWGILVVFFFFSPKETPLQGDAYVSLSAFLHQRQEWVRTCRLLDEQRLRFHQQVSCGSWRGIGGRASMGSLKLRAEMLEIISCFSDEQIFVRSFGRLPLSSAYMGWDTWVWISRTLYALERSWICEANRFQRWTGGWEGKVLETLAAC